MNLDATARLCPLSIHTPHGVLAAAVPTDLPLADLLPDLLRLTAEAAPGVTVRALADRGSAGEGWVLQRLGQAPLADDQTPAELGLRDGEVLHLRLRRERLPEADFDDLIDGFAVGVSRLPNRWRPEWGRWLLLGLAAAATGIAALAVLLARPTTLLVACGYASAVILLGAATAASRAFGDRAAAIVLAACAVPAAAAAGAQWPAVFADPETASRLLAAATSAAGLAVLAILAVGAGTPLFTAVAAATASGAGGAVAVLLGAPAGHAAAAALVAAQLALIAVPLIAFRLARRRLDPLPNGAEDLQNFIDPEPARAVMDDSRVVDAHMSALTIALAAVVCTGDAVLAATPGLSARLLVGTVSLLSLLHARTVPSARQRVALVLAGVVGAALLTAGAVHGTSAGPAIAVAVAALLVTLGCAAASRGIAERRPSPYWTSLANVAHWIAALALMPQALLIIGVFGRARGGF
jgi:type VII secretion integral membrane protein EccD